MILNGIILADYMLLCFEKRICDFLMQTGIMTVF